MKAEQNSFGFEQLVLLVY